MSLIDEALKRARQEAAKQDAAAREQRWRQVPVIPALRVRPRRSGRTLLVVIAACLVLPAWRTGVEAVALARPTTREVAKDWIRAHLPPGASIAKESYTPDFPEGTFQVFHRRFVTRLTLAELARFDYVLVANAAYGRFADPARLNKPHQREMAVRYAEIFRSWELVHEWIPGPLQEGPVLRLYKTPRPR